MKKIISFLLIAGLFLPLAAFADPMQSTNAFEIEVTDVPPGGGGGGGGGGGLSSGAVTAIALGSVFGGLGVLSGVGYYFYKNQLALKPGCVLGQNSPYNVICMENCVLEKLKNCSSDKYLMKAFEGFQPEEAAGKKYLLLPDARISNKTFNTVFFELPQNVGGKALNVKITQISNPYAMNGRMPSLDTKILLNAKGKNVKEVPTVVSQNDSANGILVKKGQITDCKNNIASINTYYNSNCKTVPAQIYALVVEFY